MYKNILVEMTRKDLSIKELAEKMKISVPNLLEKIEGVNDFKKNEIEILGSIFGNNLSFDYLFFSEV